VQVMAGFLQLWGLLSSLAHLTEALISMSLQFMHVLGTFHPLEQLTLKFPFFDNCWHCTLYPASSPTTAGCPWLPSHNLPRVEFSVLGWPEVGVERGSG